VGDGGQGARRTLIHVDPRFSRTSALADLFVPIRAGSDIAFLGGVINYVLEKGKWFREYVLRYTNASTILTEEFRDTEDLAGLFSGFEEEDRKYDLGTWQYESGPVKAASGSRDEESGLVDGPLPAHYEPQESPVANPLYPQQRNPARKMDPHPENRLSPSGNAPGAGVYPYVVTTYRLTEHFTAGGMSRWTPYLNELQPEFFCEVPPPPPSSRPSAA